MKAGLPLATVALLASSLVWSAPSPKMPVRFKSAGIAKAAHNQPFRKPDSAPVIGKTVDVLESTKQTFFNVDCKKTDTCDLKTFELLHEQYMIYPSETERAYGTRMFARYETHSLESLWKYGLVQFIRGCQFHSQMGKDGKVQKNFDYIIELGGKQRDYRLLNWMVDGFVRDPLDWGDGTVAGSRYDFYQWNSVPGSFDKETSHYVRIKKPLKPILYVDDHPGIAGFSREFNQATNIALEFRTCIYRTSDVPVDIDPANTEFGVPLKCFEWSSSWVYNHATGKIESPREIQDACTPTT